MTQTQQRRVRCSPCFLLQCYRRKISTNTYKHPDRPSSGMPPYTLDHTSVRTGFTVASMTPFATSAPMATRSSDRCLPSWRLCPLRRHRHAPWQLRAHKTPCNNTAPMTPTKYQHQKKAQDKGNLQCRDLQSTIHTPNTRSPWYTCPSRCQ